MGFLSQPIALQQPELQPPLSRAIQILQAGPVRPGLFVGYSDLVESVFADDEPGCLSAIAALGRMDAGVSPDVRAVTIADEYLGAGMTERFFRQLDDDPTTPLLITSLPAEELEAAGQRLAETLTLLDTAAPELAQEIRSLVREIVFLEATPTSNGFSFDGASSFYTWGAVFLNARRHADRISLAEGITHEAAHTLLHGYTLGAPMVDNDPDERFSSPLREDLRPMDGIVHASYVLARMHYCCTRLLASQAATQSEREKLRDLQANHQAAYLAGLEVVKAHARFTPIGREVFSGAVSYMEQAASAC